MELDEALNQITIKQWHAKHHIISDHDLKSNHVFRSESWRAKHPLILLEVSYSAPPPPGVEKECVMQVFRVEKIFVVSVTAFCICIPYDIIYHTKLADQLTRNFGSRLKNAFSILY